eukprot:EG_transcript_11296
MWLTWFAFSSFVVQVLLLCGPLNLMWLRQPGFHSIRWGDEKREILPKCAAPLVPHRWGPASGGAFVHVLASEKDPNRCWVDPWTQRCAPSPNDFVIGNGAAV